MKKVLIAFIAAALLLMLASCISPEEMLNNIQHPKIVFDTTLRVPVFATSVSVSELLQNFADELEGFQLKEGSPMAIKLTYEGTLLDTQDFQGNMSGIYDQIPISISFKTPQVQDISANISGYSVPSFSGVTTHQYLYLPAGLSGETTTSDSTEEIETGITSADLLAFIVNGSLDITIEVPTDWSGQATVVSISATILDGNNNLVSATTVSVNNDGEASFDLSGKRFETGEGSITVVYSLGIEVQTESNLSGNATLTFTPNFSVKTLEGLSIDFSYTIEKPDGVDDISFTSGTLTIYSADAAFGSIDGYVEYGSSSSPLEVTPDGSITFGLFGLTLPATIHINSATVKLSSDDLPSQIDLTGKLSNVFVSATFTPDTEVATNNQIVQEVPYADIIKNVVLNSGSITVEYQSNLPIGIQLSIKSDNFSPALNETYDMVYSIGGFNIDFAGSSLTFPDGKLVLSYAATPSGYDDTTGAITVDNVELGKEYDLIATVTYGDFDVSQITVGGTSIGQEDEINFSDILGDFKDFIGLLGEADMSATITVDLDLSATLTLSATGYKNNEVVISRSVQQGISGGDTGLSDDVVNLLKDIFKASPDVLEYGVDLELSEANVDLTENKVYTFNFELDIPLQLDLDDDMLLFSYEASPSLDLGDQNLLTAATVLITGTNTTGLVPLLVMYVNGNERGRVELGPTYTGTLSLKSEDLDYLKNHGNIPIKLEVYLKKGVQSISSEGKIDLAAGLEADVKVQTGGDNK